MSRIFPEMKAQAELLLVPTFQGTSCDLSAWGDEEAKEKDRCLEQVGTSPLLVAALDGERLAL